jgi:hypothetical protein
MAGRSIYEEIVNDKEFTDYLVHINCEYAGVKLTGVMTEETFSLAKGMNPSGSLAASASTGTIKGFAKGTLKKFFGNMGSTLIDNGLESVTSTVKTYGSSNETSFSLTLNIYPGKFGNPSSFQEISRQISKLTQPKFLGSLMTSYLYDNKKLEDLLNPLNVTSSYKIFDGDLICITIGNWFYGCGFFCTSSNENYSTIVDESGKPLALTWNATFTHYRIMDANEIANLIKK